MKVASAIVIILVATKTPTVRPTQLTDDGGGDGGDYENDVDDDDD